MAHDGGRRWLAARAVAASAAGLGLVLGAAGCGGSGSGPASASATVTLPAGFPKADVPLVPGALIAASGRTQDGTQVYSVTVQADGDGFAAARKALTDAGYVVSSEGAAGGTRTVQLTGRGYFVSVTSAAPGQATNGVPGAVNYQVSRQ
ncbi:hypothetical protein [Tsukamurella soli]|uniref:Lipoprotein n=1 Tax=Tsukamurella soli TaxID=644556 RepID=A0ABP8JWB3_9ACTN